MAKTPVPEIRLFDADEFLIHTAFRAPGAASLDDLRDAPLKVEHFDKIYSRMHRGIVAHPVAITEANAHLLDGVTFAFISIDDGPSRRVVMDKLDAIGASYVDVGSRGNQEQLAVLIRRKHPAGAALLGAARE